MVNVSVQEETSCNQDQFWNRRQGLGRNCRQSNYLFCDYVTYSNFPADYLWLIC